MISGGDPVAVADNSHILSLGLKSIQVVVLVMKLEDAFGVTLEMEEIVNNPSIMQVVDILERKRNKLPAANKH